MNRRGLLRPVGVVGLLFNLAFVVGILEVLGMMLYLAMTDQQPAFARLREAGFTPSNVAEFVLASPDRVLVAGALAVVGVLFVLAGDSSGVSGTGGGLGVDDGGFGDGGGDGGGGE